MHSLFAVARKLSLFAASRGCSLAVVGRTLLVEVSLAAERRLWGVRASAVVPCGLTCPTACGIFPGQGSNLCPLNILLKCNLKNTFTNL